MRNSAHGTFEIFDDALHFLLKTILDGGHKTVSSRGSNTELNGIAVEILNPRSRLSQTESRGRLFSCLGELCWYLAGSDDVDFIAYYIPRYQRESEDGRIFGAYGPRLFRKDGIHQLQNVTDLLRRNPGSRRAVIQLFAATDLDDLHKDVPCTCTFQFFVREEKLHMVAHMRSNDAVIGLPHDFFCFTMLQEMLARELNLELGSYHHLVGSLHIYDDDVKMAKEYLDEGFQSTKEQMPAMPVGDPWPAMIKRLLLAEAEIRRNDAEQDGKLDNLDPYWGDLIRLLRIFKCQKTDTTAAKSLRAQVNKVYWPLIGQLG